MLDKIVDFDRSLFLILNHINSPLFDGIMVFASDRFVWIPLYIGIIFFIFFRLENSRITIRPFKPALVTFVGIFITFAMTDMISADIIKDTVQRLRPGHDPGLEGLVRMLEGKGGRYGFVSSHAANVFGLALFTSLGFRRRWYSISIFSWAVLVSYSRIYVGKHFPLDVVCGALLGLLAGWLVYTLTKMLRSCFI